MTLRSKALLTTIVAAIAIMTSPTAWAQALDYGDADLWWASDSTAKHDIDVFYVLPTCVGAWTDAAGTTHFNADAYSAKHRKAWLLSCRLAKDIFGNGTNLFLPYYRQATFGSPSTPAQADSIRSIARGDMLAAFEHYMKHYNHGRRFILAGFSQGACLLVDIVKSLDSRALSRMVAAYAVGGNVTRSDLKHPNVKAARSATDTGVIVCFNSWAKMSGEKPRNALFPHNVVCINPITWSTSSRKATLLPAGSTPKAHDPNFPYGTSVVPATEGAAVTVAVDKSNHMLMVEGIDPKVYSLPKMSNYFPLGSLHLQELFFYADALRKNVKVRSRASLQSTQNAK